MMPIPYTSTNSNGSLPLGEKNSPKPFVCTGSERRGCHPVFRQPIPLKRFVARVLEVEGWMSV